MKLFRSKRGVSPLIATIILIAFAIGIGAVIMGWSSQSVAAEEGAIAGTACPAAGTADCTPEVVSKCCLPKEITAPSSAQPPPVEISLTS